MRLGPGEQVYLGLGSNLGDRQASIERAIALLGELLDITAISPLYETEPRDFEEQPPFLNAALAATTELEARALLTALLSIEERLGRVRDRFKGPRSIDLDLLFFGQAVIDEPGLTVPHPRLHQRAFVLVPLADIAPDLVHPRSKKTIRAHLAEITEGWVRPWRPTTWP